jgi:hypothetical protein
LFSPDTRFSDFWLQVIHPTLAALLPDASGHPFSDFTPLGFGAGHHKALHQLSEAFIFLPGPLALGNIRVQGSLPPMKALSGVAVRKVRSNRLPVPFSVLRNQMR